MTYDVSAPRPTDLRLRRRTVLRGGVVLAGASFLACATAPEAAPAQGAPESGALLEGLTDFSGAALKTPPVLGAVTLIDFWASWCAPCRQAFRYLDQLYRTYVGDGLHMMGVCVDEDALAGRRFWASAQPRFPVAWDAAGRVRNRFNVGSLPTTILLDAEGFLVQRNEGFDPADHRLLEEHVHRLLRS